MKDLNMLEIKVKKYENNWNINTNKGLKDKNVLNIHKAET